MTNEWILVFDFGWQYKELIAQTVRGLAVYAEIRAGSMTAEEVRRLRPIGIILTGGPGSVNHPDAPRCDPGLFALGIPILGICYGMQLMCQMLGGEVAAGGGEYGRIQDAGTTASSGGEYGRVKVTPTDSAKSPFLALMSHGDAVTRLPPGFIASAHTTSCIAACEDKERKLYGLQFHPETKHTEGGREILRQFLYDVCHAAGDYKHEDVIESGIAKIRATVGGQRVLLALSGGVDSAVCAALLAKAIPGQLVCIFVDHGFMRSGEGDEVEAAFAKRKLHFIRVDAAGRFREKLRGVTEPEEKRRRIGAEFIRVFEEEAKKLGDIPFLAQGTIYPDVVESGAGAGATIKSHHNVGGLPDVMSFEGVIEPLAGLFKDEVRDLGRRLGLPSALVKRQPFPGPGLAIRIIGAVTEEKLDIVRAADKIVREELGKIRPVPAQFFAVLTDTYAVGVKGDERSYAPVVAIRAVRTDDFMTCEYAPLPHRVLGRMSARIMAEVAGVGRVVYDITPKPPGTVEWE